MSNENRLVERMLSFGENDSFDGYPSMSCSDEGLIFEAHDEHPEGCVIAYLTYLASVHVKTPEQYANARRYIYAYVDRAWDANMTEGDNPNHG